MAERIKMFALIERLRGMNRVKSSYIKIYIFLEQNKQTKLRKVKFINLDKN